MTPLAPPERRAVDEDAADLLPRSLVLMLASGEGFVVIVDPPLTSGNQRRAFRAKVDAWSYAKELWVSNRLGFADHSTGKCRTGGNDASPPQKIAIPSEPTLPFKDGRGERLCLTST